MITVLKSKISEVKIEVCNVECEGSITLPLELMHKANLYHYERVEVNSKYGKGRISTYVIQGDRVELNGGATQHFKVGDVVHVNAFTDIPETLALVHKPTIV